MTTQEDKMLLIKDLSSRLPYAVHVQHISIEQLIEKAWSHAYSMYQTGKDNLVPLTKDEFIKAMEE